MTKTEKLSLDFGDQFGSNRYQTDEYFANWLETKFDSASTKSELDVGELAAMFIREHEITDRNIQQQVLIQLGGNWFRKTGFLPAEAAYQIVEKLQKDYEPTVEGDNLVDWMFAMALVYLGVMDEVHLLRQGNDHTMKLLPSSWMSHGMTVLHSLAQHPTIGAALPETQNWTPLRPQ